MAGDHKHTPQVEFDNPLLNTLPHYEMDKRQVVIVDSEIETGYGETTLILTFKDMQTGLRIACKITDRMED